MHSPFVFPLFLALASAATLPAASLEKRAVCLDLGPAVTDNFDDHTVLPVAPDITSSLQPTPNGTYLVYDHAGYASPGPLSTYDVPSKPNTIIVPQGYITLRPVSNGANAFGLSNFRFVCAARTKEAIVVLPASCTVTVSCNIFNAGPAVAPRSQSFSYSPPNPLKLEFGTATLPATFNTLSSCNVTLTSSKVLGVIPPGISDLITGLTLDNVVNTGQACFV